MSKITVTIWNEFQHERENDLVASIYPEGIHQAIAKAIKSEEFIVNTATLDQAEHGLTQKVLDFTDVLIWWGHKAHDQVSDEVAKRVQQAVLSGMGLIVLHSGHFSKPFRLLMGTNCSLKWREADEKERLWNIKPGHPIMQGIGEYIELEEAEMYGEQFDIPEPDELLMISWFQGGEVFRSACTWRRGNGQVFYLRPGHETYPVFYNENIITIIKNACHHLARKVNKSTVDAPEIKNALEYVPNQEKEAIIEGGTPQK